MLELFHGYYYGNYIPLPMHYHPAIIMPLLGYNVKFSQNILKFQIKIKQAA